MNGVKKMPLIEKQVELEKGPVLIVGCQRSGTSALWRALRKHSHFEPLKKNDSENLPEAWDKELWYFVELFETNKKLCDRPQRKYKIDKEYQQQLMRFISKFIEENHGSKIKRWISANPLDGLYLDKILQYHSNAKIIFLTRHPQEVVWSLLHAPWQPELNRNQFLIDAQKAARHWNRFTRILLNIDRERLRNNVKVVRHEELIESPKSILNEILDFIDAPVEKNVLDTFTQGVYHSSFSNKDTPVVNLLKRPNEFTHDKEFCDAIFAESSFWMEELSYRNLGSELNIAENNDANKCGPDLHANEKYWKKELDWYQEEIQRRKKYLPYYHHQEIYLRNYFIDLQAQSKTENTSLKVLEFGYGFGRHLGYLKDLHLGIEFYGCDISPKSIEIAKEWADKEWIDKHLKLIDPREDLPYPDNYFDVVFTVSVLIHVRPEDLKCILNEIQRVCKGHVLHLENPKTKNTHYTSGMHDGCWAHPIEKNYNAIGIATEILPEFTKVQTVYRALKEDQIIKPTVPNYLCDTFSSIENNLGKEIKRLNSEVNQLQTIKKDYEELQASRTMRLYRWVKRNPRHIQTLKYLYDKAASKYNKKTTVNKFELSVRNPSLDVLSVCHPYWHGVRFAAEGQTPNQLLLPESNGDTIDQVIAVLEDYDPKNIILNGFWEGYDKFAERIKKRNANCNIFYVHHGSFYQFLEDHKMPDVLSLIYKMKKNNIISKVGFVKHGMEKVFQKFGFDAHLLLNRVNLDRKKYPHSWSNPVKVFIPVSDHLRKNIHTQIMGALLVDEIDEIKVIGPIDLKYLKQSKAPLEKINVLRSTEHSRILDEIDQSTIVLYVTISECAPMVPIEALAAGVPCITGDNHGLFNDFNFLKENLIVTKSDDPIAIAESIMQVKERYGQISTAAKEFAQAHELKAKQVLENFLYQ